MILTPTQKTQTQRNTVYIYAQHLPTHIHTLMQLDFTAWFVQKIK